ncbi:MAG TPA: hypothetical protein DDZ97_00140 [Deltaproteobacteria bacterium]|jgi:arsenite-transporting ATPase|nr:hypothetical protein [Deltaproteobacteria bacterium]|tara:strand:- start:967 stop:2055 length:1089 start_codon:yes stop_codon:yes gene_type:complete
MAFEDENSALILLASADRYSALHQWLQELLDIQQENFDIRLVNLSGEFNLDISDFTAKNNFIAESFNHLSSLARLWEQLNPHAKEWWQLLDIASKQSIELPQLPGVEDLTRLIFLSEILDRAPESTLIIVILPAPLHALKLLDMAQQGPALIDQLLEPLLNWWDTTRQTLSTVEKLLRLRLPSSQQLRLNEIWKGRLHLLQQTISDRNNHHFTLILDGKNYKPEQLIYRLSVAGMHRAIPHLLIVEDACNTSNIEIENECRNGPTTFNKSIIVPESEQETKAMKDKNKSLSIEEWNPENLCMKIFLPGVKKDDINIQQIDLTINLILNGYCRKIDLPTELESKQCKRAQMTESWLNLWFGDS